MSSIPTREDRMAAEAGANDTSGAVLNALALVARRLRDPKIVSDIRRAAGPANLYHSFAQRTREADDVGT